jgi:Ca2+-binding EF-hand superfamily protein
MLVAQETDRYQKISTKLDKEQFSHIFNLPKDTTEEVKSYLFANFNIKYADALKLGDANGNGKLESGEVLSLIKQRKLFAYRTDRKEAAKLILSFDKNHDGYLEELKLPDSVIAAIENKIDHSKYTAFNGRILDDSDNNMRRGGEFEKNAKISVHEFINAMAQLDIVIGEELNVWKYLLMP